MSSDVFRTDHQFSDLTDERWAAMAGDESEPEVADAFVFRFDTIQEELGPDQRWSTWLDVERGSRGPHSVTQPRPGWVVTQQAAIDTELGILKTGKEADVFLLE